MAIFTTNYYKIILFDHPTAIIRDVPEHIASPRKILDGVRECKEVRSTGPEGGPPPGLQPVDLWALNFQMQDFSSFKPKHRAVVNLGYSFR